MDLATFSHDGNGAVVVAGEVDISNAALFGDVLETAHGDVIVDCAGLTFLDSAGITALLKARARAKQAGHGFELANVPALAARVLRVSGAGEQLGLSEP